MSTEWFEVVGGPDLEQGDIIEKCPIYSAIPPDGGERSASEVFEDIYDVVVLSQSCDLVTGREKLTDVVLCPLFLRSVIEADADHPLSKKGMLQNAAKNKEPAFFVVERMDHNLVGRELSVVAFRQVYTLPIDYLRRIAERRGARLRLRSPYKEALASRFASFFARVALPSDPVV